MGYTCVPLYPWRCAFRSPLVEAVESGRAKILWHGIIEWDRWECDREGEEAGREVVVILD